MIYWIDENNNRISPQIGINEEIIGISINNNDYLPGDDNQLCVYLADLIGFNANELPPNIEIIPAVAFNDDFINQGDFPGSILYDGKYLNCIVEINIEPNGFDNSFRADELEYFQGVKELLERHNEIEEDIYDGEDCKWIAFAISISPEIEISKALVELRKIYDQLMGELIQENDISNITEEEFTREYVIPALQKMGMLDVRYNHGLEEFGRDVIYQYQDGFGIRRYGAVQVKKGNISGNAQGKISEIIEQINDAFDIPYNDLIKRQEVYINQVVIVCSGKYTNNAQIKILHKIERGRNIVFFCGEDVINMLKGNKF